MCVVTAAYSSLMMTAALITFSAKATHTTSRTTRHSNVVLCPYSFMNIWGRDIVTGIPWVREAAVSFAGMRGAIARPALHIYWEYNGQNPTERAPANVRIHFLPSREYKRIWYPLHSRCANSDVRIISICSPAFECTTQNIYIDTHSDRRSQIVYFCNMYKSSHSIWLELPIKGIAISSKNPETQKTCQPRRARRDM